MDRTGPELTLVLVHQWGQVAHFAQERHPQVLSSVVSSHLGRSEDLGSVRHLETNKTSSVLCLQSPWQQEARGGASRLCSDTSHI